MTVTHVQTLVSTTDPGKARISLETGTAYMEYAKLESVCSQPKADRLVETIVRAAHGGSPRMGSLFVSRTAR